MTEQTVEDRIVSGRLWEDFCDGLKAAGQVVMRDETPDDLFNRAEGFRYLTRLLRAALEMYVEFGDPCYPQFFSLADETKKIGNDNPDNFYQNAVISGKYDYLISGKMGTAPYLSLGTKAGSYATTGTMETTGEISLPDLQVNADGSFEIIVSATPKPGNWLPMREDTHSMVVRQTFNDRKEDVWATLEIKCLNPDRDDTLDPTRFSNGLDTAVSFVKNTSNLFVDWMEQYRQHINLLPSDDQEKCIRAGGDPSIHYLQSFWRLKPDEALVIQADEIPECLTWNFQLSNYWMESLDYRYHRISINKHSAVKNADGSVTIIVAHEDPGAAYPNWLTTAGHDQGGDLFRWVGATKHPPVKTRVVHVSELKSGEIIRI